MTAVQQSLVFDCKLRLGPSTKRHASGHQTRFLGSIACVRSKLVYRCLAPELANWGAPPFSRSPPLQPGIMKVLFTDLDGTCVHYDWAAFGRVAEEPTAQGLWPCTSLDGAQQTLLLRLPPSTSGRPCCTAAVQRQPQKNSSGSLFDHLRHLN